MYRTNLTLCLLLAAGAASQASGNCTKQQKAAADAALCVSPLPRALFPVWKNAQVSVFLAFREKCHKNENG